MRRVARSSTQGFTLIEVVVALALLGLIAVVLFGSLRFGQHSHAKIIEQGGASWQVYASQRLIRSLVESAYPQQPVATSLVSRYGLEGDREKVAITAPSRLAAGAGLQRFEFATRPRASRNHDLVIRSFVDYADASTAVEETLLENVASVEWNFRDTTVPGSERWLSNWQGREALPALVRLRVTFPAGDSREWPEMVVAPRITDDANCSFDVAFQGCRGRS